MAAQSNESLKARFCCTTREERRGRFKFTASRSKLCMSLLPSTWLLRRLRWAAAGTHDPATYDACALETEFVERLRELRSLFRAAVDADDPRAWEDAFIDTWRAFSNLPTDHVLHLRPLFLHPRLRDLLRFEVSIAVSLECKHLKREGVWGTGHRVLGGVLGVGKTYVLRGLALSLATLCAVATPITLSYETAADISPSHGHGHGKEVSHASPGLVPLSLLLDAHALAESAPTEAAFLRELARQSADMPGERVSPCASALDGADMAAAGLAPVLLLDNIHTWYREDGDPLLTRGRALVPQLLHFGRRPHVHAVVAGSSSSLRDQVFAMGAWTDRYCRLKCTVFSCKSILPLRDHDGDSSDGRLLEEYLAATGACLPADLTLPQLLSLSGGVGRAIEDVLRGERAPRGRDDPVDLFHRDDAFALLATHILLSDRDNAALLDAAGEWPPPVGMDAHYALRMLRRAGFGTDDADSDSKRTGMLARWQDGGVLLLWPTHDGPSRIEFFYPYHARVLRAAFLSTESQRHVACARMELHGLSPTRSHAGRGDVSSSLEQACRPQLAALFAGAEQLGTALVVRKSLTASGSCVVLAQAGSTGGGGADPVPFVPRRHLRQIIRRAAQLPVGIADFALDVDDGDDATIWIDAWQCSSPAVGSIMRCGDFEAAQAAVIAATTLALEDDHYRYRDAVVGTCLSHASINACWAMCALVAVLLRASTSSTSAAAAAAVTFRPRTMYLRTTAVLDAGASAAAMAPVVLDAGLISAFNASPQCKSLGCECPAELAGSSFRWLVQDGVAWTDELLPRDQHGALATAMLKAREAAARERLGPVLHAVGAVAAARAGVEK